MSSKRTLILVGSLVAGIIASFLIFRFLGDAEDKAESDQQLKTVLIANSSFRAGEGGTELGTSGAIATGQRRVEDIPVDAVRRIDDIKGQTAQIDIQQGTIITKSMFISEALQEDTNTELLNPGMTAISVKTDKIRGVNGLVRQGDFVNLTITGQCPLDEQGKPVALAIRRGAVTADGRNPDDTGAEGNLGPNTLVIDCALSVFQKVRVLRVGADDARVTQAEQDAAEAGEPVQVSSNIFTFEVPARAAQNIALSADFSNIYMSLVRPDYIPEFLPIDDFASSARGVDGLTPYADGHPDDETAGAEKVLRGPGG